MKYKHNLYTLLILFCAMFVAQNAVAQVSENKYSTSSEIVLNFHVTVENDNNKELQKAFDGDKDNTWWNASSAGPKTITISLDKATELSKINYYGGGNNTETALRPTEIQFEYSSDGSNWEPFYTESDIDRTVRDQTIVIPSTSRVTSKYYRITFVPGKINNEYQTLAFNEITLYDNESKVISVRDVLNINNASIQHKSAKWFDLKAHFNLSPSVLGSFSYDEPRFDAIMSNGQKIQATHTYIDTIYMHKGAQITLALPTKADADYASSSSAQTYQRWYSYRTDGTFETNHKTSTESEKTVYDLLTPNTGNPSGGVPAYRFENGYVGRPMGAILQAMDFYYPTDEEFKDWFPNTKVDNNWFVVACDVSGYTDFSEHFESKESAGQSLQSLTRDFEKSKWFEPTLSLRVIFYIVGVDDRPTEDSESWKNGHGRLEQTDYQTNGKKYLEEYNITFPNKHLSNHTNELVAISKDARSYAIPDANNDTNTLNLKIESKAPNGNTGLLSLSKDKLTGTDRVIQFYRDGYSGQPWEVPDGTTATITVRKTVGGTTYNIARFNLTFSAASVPLTQVEVANIKDGSNFEFRSPTWMDNNLQKLTELTFDYPAGVTWEYGQKEYFTFPLAWDYSSYAFFDGSPWGDFIGQAHYDGLITDTQDIDRWYPEFDYYSLVSDYMGYADQIDLKDLRPQPGVGKVDGTGNHFLYVDASDRPGILARLPFKEKLCTGSELFVTAWMKSSGQSGSDDAAVLFTIMGVDSLENGTVTYTPLYRHSSSQIRTTCWLSSGTPGTGVGTNNWYQIYFSFLNDSENAQNFDSYILQVENNCASTVGGDYYIDDIKVYLAQPNATITQKEYTCTDTRTRMNMEIDWERLKARLGNAETGEDGISFCFMDETKYNNYLKAHPNATKAAALKESIVEIGDGDVINTKVMTMKFFNDFDTNDEFGHSKLDNDGSVTDGNFFFAYQHMKDGKPYFYRVGSETDAAGRRLTVDFYSVLSPNRPYIMLIMPDNPNSAEDGDALISDLADQIGDPCSIYTRFYVTSETLIKVNGEVVDPSVDFCAGQVFNFTVQVRVPKADGENEDYIVLDNGVYFDWFFGTEEEFRTDDPVLGTNLDVALTNFRAAYPNATELSEQTPPITDGSEITFSQAEYDLIEKYIKDTGVAAGVNNRLVLHREDLDIALLHDGLNLVVKPIQTLVPGISEEQWAQVCWEYIPLILNANGSAPKMHAGFEEVKYPTDDYNPGLRIGLQQIEEATDDENKSLRINLRKAKVVTTGASLGKINRDGLDQIFLINSDDPQYKDLFTSTDLEATSLPIGTVEDMYVNTQDMSMSYMDVRFNLKEQKISGDRSFTFNPREGYTYTFSTYFEEKNSDSSSEDIYNTCYGSFPIDMKVVPEYLVWQGGATSNWNNDANWKRADKSALKKADGDSYPTNEANTTENGFVPMLFSNVIMPKNSKAELYMAGYAEGGAAWSDSKNRPAGMELPTENIQYDLMAYDSNNTLTTQRYRVNICRDIHFEPDAQMLHAEQLLYDKAWTDVEITPGQWTAVSTPLQGVVAGDWYAPTATGKQETEYFKDITFNDNDYNRLNPAVYQRSWSTGAKIVENLQGTNTPVSFDTEWSSAYNDASVPYVAGGGFSIQGILNQGQQPSSTDKLLFRFPKADTEYTVSTAENKTVDRTTAGRLLVSQMVDRSNPLQYVHSDEVSATLTPSIDGKYLMVGNPFMAPLDVQAFVAANSDVLAQKYWISSDLTTTAVTYDESSGKWSDDTYLAAPYSVFYVEAKTPSTVSVEVKFTADMQKFATSSTDAGSQAASLKITAEAAEGSSSAAVRYAASASNGFGAEDAQMISGLTGNADNAPQVYTVAGNTAVSVNQLKDAQRIPLGVTAADGSVVTLTFSGVAAVKDAALYDAELQSETPLHEGYQLTVNGSSYGRYFLIGKGPGTTTGISDVETDDNVSVSSILPRQIVVTSDAELRSVSVWSVSGALLKKATLNGDYTCTLNNVDSDVVVVRTETANGTQMTKLRVR